MMDDRGDDEEEDELVDDGSGGNGGNGGGCVVDEEQRQHIEWKRRQNTLAARKSRQRKLLHQMELEDAVKRLRAEKDTWKARAQMYEALLRSNGINVPELS
jgi:membrane protein involved in colicin uptake